MITYYMDPRSGSCRRVSTVIKQLELDVEEVFIDLIGGGNQTPEFLQKNPNAMVPAITDGNITLWEASAIMIHLCEHYGPTNLWPEGQRRIQVLKWMFWAAEHFRIPAPIYFEENVVAKLFGKQPDASRLTEANRRIEQFAPVLETHLAGRNFVCGDEPTLADLDIAVVVSQMPRSHIPYDRYPNFMSWVKRLEQALPAWKECGAMLDQKMTEVIVPMSQQAAVR